MIKEITVQNYRSIECATLPDCGGFNVLIGKNNSGKSNILAAIETLFACASTQKFVVLDPPIGRPIDFNINHSSGPIEIVLRFGLSNSDWAALVTDLIHDLPQVKNIVDSIVKVPDLVTALKISQKGYAWFEKLGLIEIAPDGILDRTLFRLTDLGAEELFRIASELRRVEQTSNTVRRFLERFDQDDWRISRQPSDALEARRRADFIFRRYLDDAPRELIRTIREQMDRSTTYDEFIQSVKQIAEDQEAHASPGTTLSNPVETFAGASTEIPNYAKGLLARIGVTKVLHLRERRSPIGPDEAARLLSLKVKRGGPEVLSGIQQTVSALLGVKVDAFQGDATSSAAQSRAELDVDNFLVEVNGSGIREALRLVLDTEFNDPHLLLVEEPEIHLHPALEVNMMRYLKRASAVRQVFLTTHSTNFLDTVEPQNVYLVSKDRNTITTKLGFEEAEQRIPEELGLRLSSLFMYDRILFVEGPSDEAVVREWASVIGTNLSLLNVGFIHLRGIGNFAHYAAQEILNFLTRRKVKLWFLLDRDERSEGEVELIRSRVGAGAVVLVLGRRELENYLLNPRINLEYLSRRRKADGKTDVAPGLEEVRLQLSDCAERLKRYATWKRVADRVCRPVYADRGAVPAVEEEFDIAARADAELNAMRDLICERREKLEDSMKAVSDDVERRWASEKMNIVPGSELLDCWYRMHGYRFLKLRDSPLLASLMERDEIEPELVSLIEEVGAIV